MAQSEEKRWVATFLMAIGMFLVLYLFTLWFGHNLAS